jgi:hypothetical protein
MGGSFRQRVEHRAPGDPRRRPQIDLRRPVLAQHHGIDRGRTDAKPPGEVHTKAQAVEVSAGAHDAVVMRQAARNVRKWIRWIGHHENDGVRCRLDETWNQAFINAAIDLEKLQPTRGVAAVDGTPAFSLMPAVTMTSAAPARSSKSPSRTSTNGDSGVP